MLVMNRQKTIKVLKAHGMKIADFKDFLKTFGNKQCYRTKAVGFWLGY
jgi:ABC-type lipoprotein release transport system permease subunit